MSLDDMPGWWPRHKHPGKVTHRLLYAYAEQPYLANCGGEVWSILGGPYVVREAGEKLHIVECKRCKRRLIVRAWPFGGTREVVREIEPETSEAMS